MFIQSRIVSSESHNIAYVCRACHPEIALYKS